MKTRMFVLSLLALTIVSTAYTASARALEWTGTQLLTTVSAERKLDADGKFGLRAHLFDMRVPTGTMHMAFAYIGPTLSLKSDKGLTLWLSPQLVGMFNFFDGHDSVGPSLWSVLDSGRWSVFLEGEFYFGSDHRRAYYGFYAADTRLRGWANLGVHSEQVDKVLSCGPHIGGDAGFVHLEFQYHYIAEKHTQTGRIVASLRF